MLPLFVSCISLVAPALKEKKKQALDAKHVYIQGEEGKVLTGKLHVYIKLILTLSCLVFMLYGQSI